MENVAQQPFNTRENFGCALGSHGPKIITYAKNAKNPLLLTTNKHFVMVNTIKVHKINDHFTFV